MAYKFCARTPTDFVELSTAYQINKIYCVSIKNFIRTLNSINNLQTKLVKTTNTFIMKVNTLSIGPLTQCSGMSKSTRR